eukprot:5529492-Prorocentrum_lima.AAC.1
MTSSLVGSEMCIRDRVLIAKPPKEVQAFESKMEEGIFWCWDPKTTQGAVSYTHLTLPTICSV